jgi:hypothetical protein
MSDAVRSKTTPQRNKGGRSLRGLLFLALAVGLVVTACGGSGGATPTAPDIKTLASQYSTISEAGNAAITQCNKAKTAASGDLAKSKLAAQVCLTGYSVYRNAMKDINWGGAQPQADQVIAVMDKIDALITQMVNANDLASFRTASDQLPSAAISLLTAANTLRTALGLPRVSI